MSVHYLSRMSYDIGIARAAIGAGGGTRSAGSPVGADFEALGGDFKWGTGGTRGDIFLFGGERCCAHLRVPLCAPTCNVQFMCGYDVETYKDILHSASCQTPVTSGTSRLRVKQKRTASYGSEIRPPATQP